MAIWNLPIGFFFTLVRGGKFALISLTLFKPFLPMISDVARILDTNRIQVWWNVEKTINPIYKALIVIIINPLILCYFILRAWMISPHIHIESETRLWSLYFQIHLSFCTLLLRLYWFKSLFYKIQDRDLYGLFFNFDHKMRSLIFVSWLEKTMCKRSRYLQVKEVLYLRGKQFKQKL